MLLHSRTTQVYLRRRSRLFQVYSNSSNKPNKPASQSQNAEYSSSVMRTGDKINWIRSFGENLAAVTVDLRCLKVMIQCATQSFISQIKRQIIQVIRIAAYFQPASKISNTIYYLCRNFHQFRAYAIPYLNTLMRELISKIKASKNIIRTDPNKNCRFTHQQRKYQQSIFIILTDIFIFGINFTQNEFINEIFPLIFSTKHNTDANQAEYMFTLYYISHYIGIFYHTRIFQQRNRQKVLQSIHEFMSTIQMNRLKQQKIKVQFAQHELQKGYTQKQKTSKQIKKKQHQYIEQVRTYQNIRKQTKSTILQIISTIRQNHNPTNSTNFQSLLSTLQLQYMPIIIDKNQYRINLSSKGSEDEENTKSEENSRSNQDIQDDWEEYQPTVGTTRLCDVTPPGTHQELQQQYTKQELQLLNSIYNSCVNFINHKLHIIDPKYIYNQSDIAEKQTRESQQEQLPYRYIQQMPQQFLQGLKNTCTLEQSSKQATSFLWQYNKHQNRQTLVTTIFKQLYDRNNIDYIVRVLAIISKVESEDISQLIGLQVQKQRDKVRGYFYNRILKGWFGKYAAVVVEFIKFGFLSEEDYLRELLQEIKMLNGNQILSQIQNQLNLLPSSSVPSTSQQVKSNQTLSLPQIMNILQKLGRDIYYKSINSHILFNKVIREVCLHIKKKKICYDIDVINRFNGFVEYLNHPEGTKQNSIEQVSIIPTTQLRNSRQYGYLLRNLQKQIKIKQKDANGKDGLARTCQSLCKSISKQNHILSYLYAQLIQKINSQLLDEEIKKLTTQHIIRFLNSGNYQGAANWGRFWGELHRYGICEQKEFIGFLYDHLMKLNFNKSPQAVIKIICSAIQVCSSYMKNTKKISQISQSLTFLLITKKNIIRIKGLKNTILQQEIAQIMQFFHPAFKYIKTTQQCTDLEVQMIISSNVEQLMDEYYQEVRQRELDKKQKQQREKEKERGNSGAAKLIQVNGYACFEVKEQEPDYKHIQDKQFFSHQLRTPQKVKQACEEYQEKLETCDSQTNSQVGVKIANRNEQEAKPRKMKIISRCKDGSKKIGKVQIAV